MEESTLINQQSILQIAMKQSAIDCNCKASDFLQAEPVVVISKQHPEARKYLELPFVCNLVSYGSNIVATVQEEYKEIVSNYIHKYAIEHCFETPNMHVLNDAFQQKGYRVCFMAEYFLPEIAFLKERKIPYELKIMGQVLCKKRTDRFLFFQIRTCRFFAYIFV